MNAKRFPTPILKATYVHDSSARVGGVVDLGNRRVLGVRSALLRGGDVGPGAAGVVLAQEHQQVVRLCLVVGLVGVDLVAGLVDREEVGPTRQVLNPT